MSKLFDTAGVDTSYTVSMENIEAFVELNLAQEGIISDLASAIGSVLHSIREYFAGLTVEGAVRQDKPVTEEYKRARKFLEKVYKKQLTAAYLSAGESRLVSVTPGFTGDPADFTSYLADAGQVRLNRVFGYLDQASSEIASFINNSDKRNFRLAFQKEAKDVKKMVDTANNEYTQFFEPGSEIVELRKISEMLRNDAHLEAWTLNLEKAIKALKFDQYMRLDETVKKLVEYIDLLIDQLKNYNESSVSSKNLSLYLKEIADAVNIAVKDRYMLEQQVAIYRNVSDNLSRIKL